tara:strand:- start:192 stop:383 length:192 start_codon:yes stop_codon:yes gene_type:complete
MDPVANLNRQVWISNRIQTMRDIPDRDYPDTIDDLADELAELCLSLHSWRRGGGFDPYLIGVK